MNPQIDFHIKYGPHVCKLSNTPNHEVEELLREVTAFSPTDDAYFTAQFKKLGKKNAKRYLYNRRSRCFSTGLLSVILKALGAVGITGEPKGLKQVPWNFVVPFTPRKGQQAAFDALVEGGRGVVILPTGYGKTPVSAMLASGYPEARVLVSTPSVRLLHQSRDEIARFLGEPVGILGDSERELDCRVTVATIQTIAACLPKEQEGDGEAYPGDPEVMAFLAKQQVWVPDEVHGAASNSYRLASKAMPLTHTRQGLTATWLREDGCELVMEGVMGPVFHEVSYDEAFAEGALTPVVILFRRIGEEFFPPRQKPKPRFSTHYRAAITDNELLNAQVVKDVSELVSLGRTPCLVMVSKIDHGHALADMLGCPFVNGEQTTKSVDANLEAWLAGEFPVLVASSILNVGVNLKPLSSAVNAAAGDSRVETLQKLGRGLRLWPGKTVFVYVDYNHQDPTFLKTHAGHRRFTFKKYFPGRVVEIGPERPLGDALSKYAAQSA